MYKKLLLKSYLLIIKLINKIEDLTEEFNFKYPKERIYDSQAYLNYKDALNIASIDPDRE